MAMSCLGKEFPSTLFARHRTSFILAGVIVPKAEWCRNFGSHEALSGLALLPLLETAAARHAFRMVAA